MNKPIIILLFVIIACFAMLLYKIYDVKDKEQTLSFDSFNRLKVSQPYTLGDYKQYYSLGDNMLQQTYTGGSVVHNTNEASAKLSVTSTVGSRAISQSKMYHHYMPGKSQSILSSFVFFNYTPGIIKRIGYFDDRDGIFLQQDIDGILYFVIRSFTTGSVSETKIPEKEWNGNMGKWNIDINTTQLLWIDFQWLGVGRVRCGFVHKDEYILAHTFYNSDVLDKVYISHPNLPTRSEIINHSSTMSSYMSQICSTVASEGGYSEAGKDFSYISDTIPMAQGVETDIIGLKLQDTYKDYQNRLFARLSSISIYTSEAVVKFKIYKVNEFIGNPVTMTDYDGGCVIVDSLTNIGDKILMDSGMIEGGGKGKNSFGGVGDSKPGDAKKNFISQNFNSTNSEGFIVSITNTGAATNIIVSLNWREVY